MRETEGIGTSTNLAIELREIKESLDEHTKTQRKNRLWFWGLTGVFVLVTALGVAVAVDDRNDDKRECETDNANSVRDSEVLIAAVEANNENPEPDLQETIDSYRQSVRGSLRKC